MPATTVERILGAHAGRPEGAAPGEILWIDLDVRSARDFGGANVVGHLRRHYAEAPVADRARTVFTFDCVVPANTIPYAENQHICRTFAREHEVGLCDVDAGIGSHVLIERGLSRPGTTVVGTDSHLNLLGAVGCFGQGMGDADIAFSFATGRTWFEVPETMRVTVQGELRAPASAKDLTLALVGKLGSSGALGRAVEIVGNAVDALSLAGRITLCSMATEMGAIAALVRPSAAVLDWFEARTGQRPEVTWAEAGASYCEEVTLDASAVEPMVALPGSPADVRPVREVAGVAVDSVFVGSCTNGRAEDFAAVVAELGEGGRVAPGVMAKAVPATREVFSELLDDGTLAALHRAGFVVSNPGCGGCASGQIGMTGRGEVQVSTSNRNFRGKQGLGETYLASPATAAASAAAGRLTVPGGARAGR